MFSFLLHSTMTTSFNVMRKILFSFCLSLFSKLLFRQIENFFFPSACDSFVILQCDAQTTQLRYFFVLSRSLAHCYLVTIRLIWFYYKVSLFFMGDEDKHGISTVTQKSNEKNLIYCPLEIEEEKVYKL